MGYASVDSNYGTSQRSNLLRNIDTDQVEVPVLSLPGYRELLDDSTDWPVEFDLDVTDPLNADSVRLWDECSAVTVDESYGVVSELGTEPRVPRFLARLDPTEECLKSNVQSSQGLLLRSERPPFLVWVKLTDFLQLGRLGTVFD